MINRRSLAERRMRRIPDAQWATFDTEKDGTLRQWAEVPVAGEMKLG